MWEIELALDYSVYTEVNPLGDLSDRLDILVETEQFLIGSEVKVDAVLGDQQLERYTGALAQRAKDSHEKPRLIFLGPKAPLKAHSNIPISTWRDVVGAVRLAVGENRLARELISHFGSYAEDF
ncbi:PD-(D/E)XK nuclease family protein [Ruegeria sp. SCP11]|uniref:PD-(D/E)XK nuclease family protein n=1 Tax=Ruegeria sp. SCP11 TaxID=3141378 RepID=UPI003339B220